MWGSAITSSRRARSASAPAARRPLSASPSRCSIPVRTRSAATTSGGRRPPGPHPDGAPPHAAERQADRARRPPGTRPGWPRDGVRGPAEHGEEGERPPHRTSGSSSEVRLERVEAQGPTGHHQDHVIGHRRHRLVDQAERVAEARPDVGGRVHPEAHLVGDHDGRRPPPGQLGGQLGPRARAWPRRRRPRREWSRPPRCRGRRPARSGHPPGAGHRSGRCPPPRW